MSKLFIQEYLPSLSASQRQTFREELELGTIITDVATLSASLSSGSYQPILAEGVFVDGDKTKLDSVSGTNTGDQDISGITTNASAITAIQAEVDLNTAKVTNVDHVTRPVPALHRATGAAKLDQEVITTRRHHHKILIHIQNDSIHIFIRFISSLVYI